MATKTKKKFLMSYCVTDIVPASNIDEAIQLAKKKITQLGIISNASVCDEATGEEIFFNV